MKHAMATRPKREGVNGKTMTDQKRPCRKPKFHAGEVVGKGYDGDYHQILSVDRSSELPEYRLTHIIGLVSESDLRSLTRRERNVKPCPCCNYPKCGHKHSGAGR
jgi:hypothetical protein